MCKETITIRIVEEDGSFLEYTRTTSVPVEGDYLERMREYEDYVESQKRNKEESRVTRLMRRWRGPAYKGDMPESSMKDIMDAFDEYVRNDRNFNF